jgi:hypothetical protein
MNNDKSIANRMLLSFSDKRINKLSRRKIKSRKYEFANKKIDGNINKVRKNIFPVFLKIPIVNIIKSTVFITIGKAALMLTRWEI